MTELARTEPALRRLFRVVDLVPKPQDEVTRGALDLWRRKRRDNPAPTLQSFLDANRETVWSHSVVVDPVAGRRDYELTIVGNSAATILGAGLSDKRLTQIANSRLAVRLRRLFELTETRGEAALVEFVDRLADGSEARIEALAAPIIVEGRGALICILSRFRLGAGSTL